MLIIVVEDNDVYSVLVGRLLLPLALLVFAFSAVDTGTGRRSREEEEEEPYLKMYIYVFTMPYLLLLVIELEEPGEAATLFLRQDLSNASSIKWHIEQIPMPFSRFFFSLRMVATFLH